MSHIIRATIHLLEPHVDHTRCAYGGYSLMFENSGNQPLAARLQAIENVIKIMSDKLNEITRDLVKLKVNALDWCSELEEKICEIDSRMCRD